MLAGPNDGIESGGHPVVLMLVSMRNHRFRLQRSLRQSCAFKFLVCVGLIIGIHLPC